MTRFVGRLPAYRCVVTHIVFVDEVHACSHRHRLTHTSGRTDDVQRDDREPAGRIGGRVVDRIGKHDALDADMPVVVSQGLIGRENPTPTGLPKANHDREINARRGGQAQ